MTRCARSGHAGSPRQAEGAIPNPLNAQLNVVVGFNKVYNYRDRLKGNLP
jgi:hypothetical protein